VYDAPHAPRPWGWKVSAYLWTKSIAAGALMMAAYDRIMKLTPGDPLFHAAAAVVALVFLALTMALLVFDLKRPDRFHYVLIRGHWRSWLVRGAFILMAYGLVAALWLVVSPAHHAVLVLPALALAVAAAGYSAFLFGQAEGRDFWQSPLLLPHLVVAAMLAGAASLILVGTVTGASELAVLSMGGFLAVALILHGSLMVAELGVTHANTDVARAARLLTHGAYQTRFLGLAVVVGVLLPFLTIVLLPGGIVIGALLALVGLWAYEDLWVKAGQSIPLS
jgi:formate-dependent nitrite reductase membrane component NrfD